MKFQYSHSVLRANRRNHLSWALLALLLPAAPALQAQTPHATGIDDTTVYLNDLEDHTWTYYSAKPDADYPNQLRSPDPRNVKITYQAGSVDNASAPDISATEGVNTIVYYKTIEKKAWGESEGRWLTGDYAYRAIFNPFQKRPRTNGTNGTNGFWGFDGWEVVSGGEYISEKGNGDNIAADELIHFTGVPAGNAVQAEVVLRAKWAAATVTEVNGDVSGNQGTAGYSYERNFVVVRGNNRTVGSMGRNVTVMGCYPDGTGATGASLSTVTGSANDLKIENINLGTGGSDFTVGAGWLIVGRGCTGRVRRIIGNNNDGRQIRIESGIYNFVNPMLGGSGNANNWGRLIFGCDYDRATNDGIADNDAADNSTLRHLRVINYVSWSGSGASKNSGSNVDEFMDITIKSGYYGFSPDYSLYANRKATLQDGLGLGLGGNTDNAASRQFTAPDKNGVSRTYQNLAADANNTDYTWFKTMSFYVGGTRSFNGGGVNRILIEGGELSSVNGGGYQNGGNGVIGYHLRVKGGWIKGALYGTASSSNTVANTKQVITGGEINGWIAGACNGTDLRQQGENNGDTYIYVGGTAEVRSHHNDGVYNNAWGLVGNVQGGNVFASGRGKVPETTYSENTGYTYCGSSNTTYAVVADNSQVEQGVYGGGYIGVTKNSHIYITGGTTGKVFGGASTPISTNNTWMTQTTDIRQYGGTVKEGIYGGHYQGTGNAGKIHQTTTLQINGGQVGVDVDHPGNIHGGGYGAGTSVGGNVTVTLGDTPATTGGVTVYGNVYGGSALGDVNTNGTNTTTITLNRGTVNGNLFGGALGEGADVNGKITVDMKGGTVSDGVFGGGDAAAYSPNSNHPVVNMTGGTAGNVYGGGKGATAIVTGNPQVTISGTATVNGNVYGGGNAAEVHGNTYVKMQD